MEETKEKQEEQSNAEQKKSAIFLQMKKSPYFCVMTFLF